MQLCALLSLVLPAAAQLASTGATFSLNGTYYFVSPLMTTRLPPIIRDKLDEDGQKRYDALDKASEDMFGDPKNTPFIMKQPSDGALVGPFPFFVASRDVGESFMKHTVLMSTLPGLPADAKEVAILTVGAHFKAEYELYAHINVAKKVVGFSADTVDKLVRGVKPEGLNDACSLSYDVTKYLISKPGPLPTSLWDDCISKFGRDGTMALIHYIGAYSYLSMALNATDAKAPE